MPDVASQREGSSATTLVDSAGVVLGSKRTKPGLSEVWLDPLTGVGSDEDKKGGGSDGSVDGGVRVAHHRGRLSDGAGVSPILNSGAADGPAVKYDGDDPNGGEPRKMAAVSEASCPTEETMPNTTNVPNISTPGTASHSGKESHKIVTDTENARAESTSQTSTSSQSTTAFATGVADTGNLPSAHSQSSDDTDVAGGTAVSGKMSAPHSPTSEAAGEHGQNSLFRFGFKKVGIKERRRQHDEALAALGPYLTASSAEVIDLTGAGEDRGMRLISKKKKAQARHVHTLPVPIPRRSAPPGAEPVRVKLEPESKPKTVSMKAGSTRRGTDASTASRTLVKKEPVGRRDGKATGTGGTERKKTAGPATASAALAGPAQLSEGGEGEFDLKKIKIKREKELAEAVRKVRDLEDAERAMLARVHASQPPLEQSYLKRLRSAIYFDDSGSEGETAAAVEPDSSDSVNSRVHETWEHEPRHNKSELIQDLQRRVNETMEENRQMKVQMRRIMRMMAAHMDAVQKRKGDTSAGDADVSGEHLTSCEGSSAFERVIGHAQRSPIGQASVGGRGSEYTESPISDSGLGKEDAVTMGGREGRSPPGEQASLVTRAITKTQRATSATTLLKPLGVPSFPRSVRRRRSPTLGPLLCRMARWGYSDC